jgi:thioredoxin reductase
METDWDCVVVGGGAAGLSAALVLGRARQPTLVIDAGDQSNLPAHGIGGLLGHDGRSPAAFYAAGREELAAYPTVQLHHGEVLRGERADAGFVFELADGGRARARRVLLATGMEYRYRALPGIAERWGRSVFHCPFCHGWEVRGQTLAVLDRGATGVHRALLLHTWTERVTLLTDGPSELEPGEARRLHIAGVSIDERPVVGLVGSDGTLERIGFEDGTERPLTGMLVPVTLHQRSELPWQLGAVAKDPGPLVADAIEVDARFQTSVPGLYAAGDAAAAAQAPSVATAIASGSFAAAMLVGGIAAEGDNDTPQTINREREHA